MFKGGHEAYARGARLNLAMNRGLALKFKSIYPDMKKQYRAHSWEGEATLGDVFCYETSDDRPTVFNLLVQRGPDRVLFSAFESAVERMYHLMIEKNFNDVGMSRIGVDRGTLTEEQFFEGLSRIRDSSRRHVTVYE